MYTFNVKGMSFSELDCNDLKEYIFTSVKKNQVRRLAPFARVFVDKTLEIIRSNPVEFISYTSRHGELSYSHELIKSIITKGKASPMMFTHSVHNSTAGITTTLLDETIPMTSISAGCDSLVMGVVSAIAQIYSGKYKKVLVGYCDAVVPDIYKKFDGNSEVNKMMILIVEKGDDFELINDTYAPPFLSNESQFNQVHDFFTGAKNEVRFGSCGNWKLCKAPLK